MKNFKQSLLVVLISFVMCVPGYAELTREVDEFDGEVELSSTIVLKTTYEKDQIPGLGLFSISSGQKGLLGSYLSDESYIFNHSPAELKINDFEIMELNYVMQRIEALSYYPEAQYLNAVVFIVSDDAANKIIQANTIKIRMRSSVGDIIYDVPDYMLSEWKSVLNTPFHPECIGSQEYQSSYQALSWGCRESDEYYSIDILTQNCDTVIHQGIKADNNLHAFYPETEGAVLLPGTYCWKIWSPFGGYGGEGFEGTFAVSENVDPPPPPTYQSTYNLVQWENRGVDTKYCIDICDENFNIFPGLQALQCGEGFHSWSPKDYINNTLGIHDGLLTGFKFNWRIWSDSGYGGEGFEGSVICQ